MRKADGYLMLDGSRALRHGSDGTIDRRMRTGDDDFVADVRIERRSRNTRAKINFEHALIHADVTHLMNRTIIKSKVDFARKQTNQAIGIPDRNRADLHAARTAVVHAVAYAFAHGHQARW